MERASALPTSRRLPTLALDPKRIAATSVAIALHVAVLLLLLVPSVPVPVDQVEDSPMTVVPVEIKKVLPPPPPTPTTVAPRHDPHPAPVAIQDPPQIPIDETPSAMDTYVPPVPNVPIANTYEPPTGDVFAQITADVAPVPPYPAQAITRRLVGEVMLRIRVDASGAPREVTIERSSGFAVLDQAAAKFVKARWHFVPAMQDGRAVEAFALLPISFVLPR